ncbi:MAG: M48 family metalloprotease [Candidatus Aenigmarchaeota archaeon]|nr:M48 family metalloprotease [Candidatus Aenigmarchaeota archaeon]
MPAKLYLLMSVTMLFLFALLFGLLALIGYFFNISDYVIVFSAIALVLFQWYMAPRLIELTMNMRYLNKNEYPEIWKNVKEICKKTKTPIPRIAILRSGSPNAFVFGRTPKSATLVLSSGLLKILNKNELKAVIAHEIGHINHKDMIVMTLVGSIPVIAYHVYRFLMYSEDERRKGGALMVALTAFLVYLVSNLLVLLLSRLREYHADRFGAINTKPRWLINALVKITYGLSVSEERINENLRSFYIADPITSKKEIGMLWGFYSDLRFTEREVKEAMEWEKRNPSTRILEIFHTHPLTFKRIEALMKLEKEKK